MKIPFCKHCNMDFLTASTGEKCALCKNIIGEKEVPDNYFDDF